MKKALLAALCFVIVGLVMVNGTFALPDLNEVFADLSKWWGELGLPTDGGTVVDVELVPDEGPQNLFPGSDVSRSFHVKNQGTGNVYFRLVYAVQHDAESWEHLNISFDAGAGFIEECSTDDGFDADGWKTIEIGGTPYKMKVFTYNVALASGKASSPVEITISMDTSVTSEQMTRYRSDFLQAQALAIDPTPFAENGYKTAVEALDLALPLDTLNPF